MIIVLILLSIFTLLSCDNANETIEDETTYSYEEYKPKSKVDRNYFQSFKVSQCINDCKDPGKIYKNEYINGKLYLKFGHWFNCALGDSYKANLTPSESGDSLYFSIRALSMSGPCECYFYVNCVITNLKKQPKKIIINNMEIGDYHPSVESHEYVLEEEALEGGGSKAYMEDGTIRYTYENGTIKYVSSDGTVKEISKDGTEKVYKSK